MSVQNFDNDLYLVTHPHPDWFSTVTGLISQGVQWVQIRDKTASDLQVFEQANAIIQFCERHQIQCTILINDRVSVAKSLGVGVHLGQGDMSPQEARTILGPHVTIGWTIHDDVALGHAAKEWIDYVGVGPVFPTATKVDTRSVLGPGRLTHVVQELDLPVVAIGGIQQSNIQTVRHSNPWKIAMSSALMQAGTLEGFAIESLVSFYSPVLLSAHSSS